MINLIIKKYSPKKIIIFPDNETFARSNEILRYLVFGRKLQTFKKHFYFCLILADEFQNSELIVYILSLIVFP